MTIINPMIQVDIIAFSEDGLTGFEFLKSEYLLPFTQVFPYRASGWNACQNKGSTEERLMKFYLHFLLTITAAINQEVFPNNPSLGLHN